MKKILYSILALTAVVGFFACDNSLDKTFDDMTLVEFQTTVVSTPAVGKTYPLVTAGNSLTAGATLTTQINLVGRQRTTDETIRVTVDKENTTAVEGTHYILANGGNVVIPANSSTGTLTITVPKATTSTATSTVNLVLTLEGNGSDIRPSENYKKVGYTIRI